MEIHPLGESFPLPHGPAGTDRPDAPGRSFWETLKKSIDQVNEAQIDADQALSDMLAGKQQDLHQTLIAMEKADITFQLMMQIRNKIVSAYEEINRIQG